MQPMDRNYRDGSGDSKYDAASRAVAPSSAPAFGTRDPPTAAMTRGISRIESVGGASCATASATNDDIVDTVDVVLMRAEMTIMSLRSPRLRAAADVAAAEVDDDNRGPRSATMIEGGTMTTRSDRSNKLEKALSSIHRRPSARPGETLEAIRREMREGMMMLSAEEEEKEDGGCRRRRCEEVECRATAAAHDVLGSASHVAADREVDREAEPFRQPRLVSRGSASLASLEEEEDKPQPAALASPSTSSWRCSGGGKVLLGAAAPCAAHLAEEEEEESCSRHSGALGSSSSSSSGALPSLCYSSSTMSSTIHCRDYRQNAALPGGGGGGGGPPKSLHELFDWASASSSSLSRSSASLSKAGRSEDVSDDDLHSVFNW